MTLTLQLVDHNCTCCHGSRQLEPNTGNPCTTRGNGTLYVFDIRDGKGYFEDGSGDPARGLNIGAGLPTDPRVSVGVGGKKNRVFVEKSGADLFSMEEEDIESGGRLLYWRERR